MSGKRQPNSHVHALSQFCFLLAAQYPLHSGMINLAPTPCQNRRTTRFLLYPTANGIQLKQPSRIRPAGRGRVTIGKL